MFRRHHPADHLLLLAYERELDPGDQAGLDAHLAECEPCRHRSDRLQAALSCVALEAEDHDGTPDVDAAASRRRLQHALRSATPQPGAGWNVQWTTGASALPVAMATLVVVLALSWSAITSGVTGLRVSERGAALPIERLTPGAVAELDARALCAGERPSRVVPVDVREQVLAAYGMGGATADTYELDALITPDLGGIPVRANLWPQRYSPVWNAHVKDALENLLAARVCSQQMPLAAAQQALATDWVSAYKRYFDTDRPLPQHIAATDSDVDLIVDSRVAPVRLGFRALPPMQPSSCSTCAN